MLSFGAPNGLTAPFNFPGAPSGMGQSAAGFPFGASADHFSHAATLAAASKFICNRGMFAQEISNIACMWQ